MFKQHYYWSVILAVFFVAAGLIIYFGFAPETKAPEGTRLGENKASLLIDFGVKKRMFVGETVDNMTVLDALNFSADGNNVEYKLDNTKNYLAAVDGFANDGKIWATYLNGIKQAKTINEIVVKAGDEVELKFE